MKINNTFKLVIAIAVCEVVGIGGTFFTSPAVSSSWYSALEKPFLQPPGWIFGPVWTALYALMGISLFLAWKQHPYILENVRMLRIWRIAIVSFLSSFF